MICHSCTRFSTNSLGFQHSTVLFANKKMVSTCCRQRICGSAKNLRVWRFIRVSDSTSGLLSVVKSNLGMDNHVNDCRGIMPRLHGSCQSTFCSLSRVTRVIWVVYWTWGQRRCFSFFSLGLRCTGKLSISTLSAWFQYKGLDSLSFCHGLHSTISCFVRAL